MLARDDAERYALTPEGEAFLVSRQPGFLGGMFRHVTAQLPPNWLRLADVWAAASRPPGGLAAERAPFLRRIRRGFFPISYPAARALAAALDLAGPSAPVSVLDLGAGSGVWGIALAQASPHVTVRAVDWPEVLPVTRRVAERFGVGDG